MPASAPTLPLFWPKYLSEKKQAQESSADLLFFPRACEVGMALAAWSWLSCCLGGHLKGICGQLVEQQLQLLGSHLSGEVWLIS